MSLRKGKFGILILLASLALIAMQMVLGGGESAEAQQAYPSRFISKDIPHIFSPPNQLVGSGQTFQQVETISWSKVVFQSFRDGNWNIYIGNDDGSGQTRLTNSGAPEMQPNLNRGNTQIVFTRKSGDYEIIKMDANGGNQVALTANNADDVNPVWSPDGTKVAFESYRDGQAEIYVMNANGTGQTRLTMQGEFDGMPTWSPDGTKIAFVSRRTGGYRIWVMNANGTNQVQLSNQPYSLHPQWSPDGTQIAFDADADGDGWQDLWRMNVDGSSQQMIFNPYGNQDAWAGSWSPDGRHISFTRISFVQYQGNWYWTDAYLDAWDSTTFNTFRLSQNGRDWTPHWQTSDITPPSSQVNNLPTQSPGPIPVSWSGTDQGGSGIIRYDVQVKVGANGTWTNWREKTYSSTGQYYGTGGNTYFFRVRSYDRAFNVENWPIGYDVSTTVENIPPASRVVELYPYTRFTQDLLVNWVGEDPGGSGIANYDVQYRVNNGGWTNWQTRTFATSAILENTQPGEKIDFRVRATDRAQNVEAWQNQADGQTNIYRWGITGTAYDNTRTPIGEAQAVTSPAAMGILPSDAEGSYGSYIASNSSFYNVAWNKNGYTSLPETPFPSGGDRLFEAILPPADNVVSNWGFESGSFTPSWTIGGTAPPFITNTIKHTGQSAVWLGDTQPMTLETIVNGRAIAVDATGRAHIVWQGENATSNQIFYMYQLSDGSWTAPQTIVSGSGPIVDIQIEIGLNGEVHVVWIMGVGDHFSYVYYTVRSTNGSWSAPVRISRDISNYYVFAMKPTLSVSENGVVHLAWLQEVQGRGTICGKDAYYARRSQNGSWSTPRNLTNQVDCSGFININTVSNEGALSDGLKMVTLGEKVHMLWNVGRVVGRSAGFYYFQRLNNGTWLPFETVVTNGVSDHFTQYIDMEVDSKNNTHVIWRNSPENQVKYAKRSNTGVWTESILLGSSTYHKVQLEIDSTDMLHAVWWADNLMYAVQSGNSPWEIIQEVPYGSGYSVSAASMLMDDNDNLHLMWVANENGANKIYYSVKTSSEQWAQMVYPIAENLTPNVKPVVDSAGNFHALIIQSSTSYPFSYFYYGPRVTEASNTTSFSQTITVPVTMTSPVLSFMYQLGGMDTGGNSSFAVRINGGDDLVAKRKTNVAGWTHEWVDLSNWAGETVELSFNLDQAANTNRAWGVVDEVTIGSTFPDVWVAREDDAAFPGGEVRQIISYGNRGGAIAESVTLTYTLPVEMTFISASVPPSSVNPLVWDLGTILAKGNVFEIEVVVRVASSAPGFSYLTNTAVISTTNELEILNNRVDADTYTAISSYLPMIFR